MKAVWTPILFVFAAAAWAQPVVAPTSEHVGAPRGTNVSEYNIVDSFETGYRFHSVDGNVGKYRSDVNYGNGVRLLSSQLTVNTRRYLITPTLALEGLPPHHVRQFQSEGDGTLSVRAGATYPSSAQLQDRFMALVAPDDSPTQGMPVQSELSATLTLAP